jgi:hypothetical protein
MAAMAPGCIGEDDGGRIAATPATFVAWDGPSVAGFGLARLGVEKRCPGIVHEQTAGQFEVDQHTVDDRTQMIGLHGTPACQG